MIRSSLQSVTWVDDRWLLTTGAAFAAIAAGLLIVSQPLTTTLLIIGAVLLVFLMSFTPLIALVVMLIIAPMRTLIATEVSISLPLDIGQITLIVFIGAWVVRRIADHRSPFRLVWSDVYWPLILFIIATALTITRAASVSAWVNEWLKWVITLALVMLLMNTRNQRHWQWIVFGLVLAGTANALVGIYIFFGGSGALHLLVNNRFFRAFGTFGQPNPFGGFMGLLAPIAIMMVYGHLLALWRVYRSRRQIDYGLVMGLLYYAFGAGLITIGLFISWSRGAWLGFGLSILVLLIAFPPKLWQGIFVVGIAGTILGGIWSTGQLPASITDRIGSATQEIFTLNDVRAVDITTENYPIVERLAHWQAALNMAEANFWLGVGFGNYEATYNTYQLINWNEPLGHAHNYYLNIFGEAGVIGLIAYLVMFGTIVAMNWRLRRHPDVMARSVAVGLLGTWVYLLSHSLTDNLYVNNLFLHIGVMLGIMAILQSQIQSVRVIYR